MPGPAKINLQKYLATDLFAELDLGSWPDEEREAFLESFGNVIQMRIITRLLAILDDTQKDAFEALLKDPGTDDAALAQFLMITVPTFEDIISEEIGFYKKQIIDQLQKLQKKADTLTADT